MNKKSDKMDQDQYTQISQKYARHSQIFDIWKRFIRNKGALVGLVIIVCILFMALFSSLFIDYSSVTDMNIPERLQ